MLLSIRCWTSAMICFIFLPTDMLYPRNKEILALKKLGGQKVSVGFWDVIFILALQNLLFFKTYFSTPFLYRKYWQVLKRTYIHSTNRMINCWFFSCSHFLLLILWFFSFVYLIKLHYYRFLILFCCCFFT